MERAEAAEFLGVSLSTLDRLASQGRLTRGRAKRKTRPVTVFDEEELRLLKEELQETKEPQVFLRQNTPKASGGVGFRLDPYYAERLVEEGRKRGVSAGEHARTLVIRALEDDREEAFRSELSRLRQNLAQMFYTVLVAKLGADEKGAMEIVEGLLGSEDA